MNLTEPRPGEPLSDEAERGLADVPASIDDEPEHKVRWPDGPAGSDELPDDAETAASLLPKINFNESKVRKFLIEAFDTLANRFKSAHWKLTDNQADMLSGPTAELMGGIYTKLSVHLPDALVGTPGATAFLLAVAFVVAPKVAQQMAISRARSQGASEETTRRPGPVPAQARRQGPVGPIADAGADLLRAE